MKLLDREIWAMVDLIEASQKKENENKLKAEKSQLEVKLKPRAKQLFKIWKTIPPELKTAMFYDNNLTEAKIAKKLLGASTKKTSKAFNRQEMRNKIVIASMDSKTVDELKVKLGVKF